MRPPLPLHCKQNPIYVLREKKLRGLSPNFHIYVSVSDLYIPPIGPPIFLQRMNRTEISGLNGVICQILIQRQEFQRIIALQTQLDLRLS
jgi:hypothetical protein